MDAAWSVAGENCRGKVALITMPVSGPNSSHHTAVTLHHFVPARRDFCLAAASGSMVKS